METGQEQEAEQNVINLNLPIGRRLKEEHNFCAIYLKKPVQLLSCGCGNEVV